MGTIAAIKNELVENTVSVEPDTEASTIAFLTEQGFLCVETDVAGPGWSYINGVFEPPPTPPAPVDPCEWFIDLGPFFDRFGDAKLPVLMSTDSAIKAIIADVNIRKWVDLKRADVTQSLAYIGSVVPALTPALQADIMTTPVTTEENLALRKLYF